MSAAAGNGQKSPSSKAAVLLAASRRARIAWLIPQGDPLCVDARSVLSVREYGKMARTPLAAFFNIPFMETALCLNLSDTFDFYH